MSYNKRYKFVREIGAGTSGRAILVQDTFIPGLTVVLKEIPLDHKNGLDYGCIDTIKQEVSILSALSHPHIVKYLGSFEENGFLYLITEYADMGDLYQLLKRSKATPLPEDKILGFTYQLISALSYLHDDKKILHRDIKSRNIFLFSATTGTEDDELLPTLKLGDFGISRPLTSTLEMAYTAIGTPYYLSPEICESKPYDYKSDLWSLGCVIYEMCALRHAFDSMHIRGLILKIIKADYAPIPQDLSLLISSLLQKDPKNRPNARELLSLPFFAKFKPQKPIPVRFSSVLPVHCPENKIPSISKRFKSLVEIIGDKEKAFDLIAQYIFGTISKETIFSYYKWSDRDSYEEILQHIEWCHDQRSLANNHLTLPQGINEISFSRISAREYLLNGKTFKLGSFGTIGSSILYSWIKEPTRHLEDTPSSGDLSSIINRHKNASSVYLKLEIIKEHLVKELGRHTFAKISELLKEMVYDDAEGKDSKPKVITEHQLKEKFGNFMFSLLSQNQLLILFFHLILHEKLLCL